jgi:hypothetical protein
MAQKGESKSEREKKSRTTAQLEGYATALAYCGWRYHVIASQMRDNSLASVDVLSVETLERSLGFVRQGVLRAQEALDESLIAARLVDPGKIATDLGAANQPDDEKIVKDGINKALRVAREREAATRANAERDRKKK